jgi:hypothetical protein
MSSSLLSLSLSLSLSRPFPHSIAVFTLSPWIAIMIVPVLSLSFWKLLFSFCLFSSVPKIISLGFEGRKSVSLQLWAALNCVLWERI